MSKLLSRSSTGDTNRPARRLRTALARFLRGGGGGGSLLTTFLLFSVHAADAQFTVSPTSFPEDAEYANVRFVYRGTNVVNLDYATRDGTATDPDDYIARSGRFIVPLQNGTAGTIGIQLIDDNVRERDEYFILTLNGIDYRITIEDNDEPDPILQEISNHSIARAEALIENQPRLIPMHRNLGTRTSEFLMKATDGGVDTASGRFQDETVWGSTSLSRTSDGVGEHVYLLTTLGAHFRMSKRLHLGGMLQFDRSGTEPGGDGISGESTGNGWMVGPYFTAREASQPLYFEGRLLYGRDSNDVEDYVPAQGEDARSTSLESERWLIQGRVEGTHQLGNGMTLIPLADFSHARDEMEAFVDSRGIAGGNRTVAVTNLQLGAEFEIPVETSRGDLKLRPGLRLVVSDASNVSVDRYATVGNGEAAKYRGRVGFGVDYRLEDDLVLGFESYYSRDQEEFESYGAGLNLQFEF